MLFLRSLISVSMDLISFVIISKLPLIRLSNFLFCISNSSLNVSLMNSIQNGCKGGRGAGGRRVKKDPPTSFSSATSANVGISSPNLMNFTFNPFFDTGVKFQVCTQNLNQDHPSKSVFSRQILIKLKS